MKQVAPVAVGVCLFTSISFCQIPEIARNCTAYCVTNTDVLIFCELDGTGASLDSAVDGNGNIVDATIVAEMVHWSLGDPLVGIPAEDVWLESVSFNYCSSPLSPNGPSDADGYMFFTGTLSGGGSMNDFELCFAGDYFPGLTIDNLFFNSPDINGDNTVDLSDRSLFIQALNGPYDWKADFNFDGIVNLNDIIYFTKAVTACQ